MSRFHCKGVCLLLLPLLLFLSGCSHAAQSEQNDTLVSDSLATDTASTIVSTNGLSTTLYQDEDFLSEYDDTATFIAASGSTAEITGSGAIWEEGLITIRDAGTYVLSGTFTGQVEIAASSDSLVHLVLNGVTLHCENGAAIFGIQSKKLILTLAEDTENIVEDGASYQYETPEEDEPNAAIFSKDDLVLNGTGTLTVKGNYEDGIRSKDDLRILSGSYHITAPKDAIQGKDSVAIAAGTFTIEAGNDAIKSSNDQDSQKGYVVIDAGTYRISCGDDAFHAETSLTINGGDIQIEACTEGIEGLTVLINGGSIHVTSSDDGINAAGGSQQEGPFGGMDAGDANATLTINGGAIYLDTGGDGIDSNGYFYLNGGEIYIDGPENAGNGALDYGLGASITGGTIVAAGASGMAMHFDQTSTQCAILYYLPEWQTAGTTVTLSDGEEILLSYTLGKRFDSVLLSIPSMVEGNTYTLTCGTVTEEITLSSPLYSNGSSTNGFHPGNGGRPGRDLPPENGSGPKEHFPPVDR